MKRYVIYLTFDPDAESALQSLRKELAVSVPQLPDISKKMRPHLTLLVFDDEQPETVLRRFEELANIESFKMELDRIGEFSGRRYVLFVKPLLTDALQNAYLRCFDVFQDSFMAHSYRDPEAWNPHVTLAKGMNEDVFIRARDVAISEWKPLQATIHSIGLINAQKPLEVLASRKL